MDSHHPNIAVLYQTMRGNTQKAAEATGSLLADLGARVSVRPVDRYDIKEMAQADIILLGTWTDGFVLAGQRPGQLGKFKQLPTLEGKRVGVFTTCKFWPGSSVSKFANWAEFEGAQVIASHGWKSSALQEGAEELAKLVWAGVPVAN